MLVSQPRPIAIISRGTPCRALPKRSKSFLNNARCSTLIMIDQIQGKMVPSLTSLLRTSARQSPSLTTASYVRRFPKHKPHPQIRFYASPTTVDPRAPYPVEPQFLRQAASDPQFSQQAAYSSPQNFEDPKTYPPPPKQEQPPPNSSARPYIYATLFLIIGAYAGRSFLEIVFPPTPYRPDSFQDRLSKSLIRRRAARLPLVQTLSADPAWRFWDAYYNLAPHERRYRLTAGPLRGSRGIGAYQRVWHNAATGEFVTVVWLGAALTGWPNIVHGGVTATLLDESMGRCAIARFAVSAGVTAHLEVNYQRPVSKNAFYVVRVRPVEEGSTDRKGWVEGTVESLGGKVLVQARGLFVVPKKVPQSALKTIEVQLDEDL